MKTFRTRIFTTIYALIRIKTLLMFLAALGFSAHAATVPYDNFDGSDLIDTSRWQDPVNFSNFIENGKLRVEQKRLGSTRSNSSRFSNPGLVNTIQATVNIAQISDSGALVRARAGGFFCDSDNTANGDTGEIFAETGIGQQDGTPIVRLGIFQCTDASCSTGNDLLIDTTSFGVPTFNIDHTIGLAFDEGTKTFTFSYDGSQVSVGPAQIPELSNCGSSNDPFKAIGSRITIHGDNPSQEGGHIVATFDDIAVNGSLYDDFSGSFMDASKWNERDLERTVLIEEDSPGNNVVRFRQRRGEINSRSLQLGFPEPESVSWVKTDVKVNNVFFQDPNDGNAFTRVRIDGLFYNDGSSQGPDDLTGNVWATVALEKRSTGQNLFCSIQRVDDPNWTVGTTLFLNRFGTWNESQTYAMTLGFDKNSNTFTCQVDDQVTTYTLQPGDPQPNAPAASANMNLATRIYDVDGPGEYGEISAVFDNIETNPLPSEATLTISDGKAEEGAGQAVAIQGDTMAVGVQGTDTDPGRVILYRRVTTTNSKGLLVKSWTPIGEIQADDASNGDGFGSVLAFDGTTLAVGAPNAGQSSAGAAYVFTANDAGNWNQQQAITGNGSEKFGSALAIESGTLVIGAPDALNAGQSSAGAAYVYTAAQAGNWNQQQTISGNGSEKFGSALALSGGQLAIGAPHAGQSSAGAAYLYTTSNLNQPPQAISGNGSEKFGSALAIEGGTLVIGAPATSLANQASAGSAYVYTANNSGNWSVQQQLTGNASEKAGFGTAVALQGTTVVIGANGANIGDQAGQGAAYAYIGEGNSWNLDQILVASDGTENDAFGSALAIDQGTILVGAPLVNVGGNANQGAAYVFSVTNTAPLVFLDGFE